MIIVERVRASSNIVVIRVAAGQDATSSGPAERHRSFDQAPEMYNIFINRKWLDMLLTPYYIYVIKYFIRGTFLLH